MQTESTHVRAGDDRERECPESHNFQGAYEQGAYEALPKSRPVSRTFAGLDHSTIYSAPRRFDMATVLTVMGAYALLFTAMRLLQWPPAVLGMVGGFFTVVALGQALLFGGNAPRLASVLVGIAYWSSAVMLTTDGNLCLASTSVFWGGISGYVAGTLVGGIFLVADAVRRPS